MSSVAVPDACPPLGGPDLLAAFSAGGEPPDDLTARILGHPRFAAAARALAVSAVETATSRANRAHGSVDAGRYVAKLAAMWLDARGELTLPALKRLCVGSGLLSAGRARSFIRYLEHIGAIQEVEAGAGARPARYRATPLFRADWIGHLRGPIAAVTLIAPSARGFLARLDDPAVAASFIEIQGGLLLRSAASLPAGEPTVEAFYHPAGGLQVLSLVIAGTGDDAAFPSRRAALLPIAATIQAAGVSALQIRRVLKRARDSGLLEVSAGPAYALTARADATLRFIYAGQLAQLLRPIARTLARHP